MGVYSRLSQHIESQLQRYKALHSLAVRCTSEFYSNQSAPFLSVLQAKIEEYDEAPVPAVPTIEESGMSTDLLLRLGEARAEWEKELALLGVNEVKEVFEALRLLCLP